MMIDWKAKIAVEEARVRVAEELYPAELDLQITEHDIVEGRRGSIDRCAVARAVARRFDGDEIGVSGAGVRLWDDDGSVMVGYSGGDALRDLVDAFDADGARREKTLRDRVLMRSGTGPLVVTPRTIHLRRTYISR